MSTESAMPPGETETESETESETDSDPFTGTPYADSPEGWWTEYGGAFDMASGVVHFPQGTELPPCQFPCHRCRKENPR